MPEDKRQGDVSDVAGVGRVEAELLVAVGFGPVADYVGGVEAVVGPRDLVAGLFAALFDVGGDEGEEEGEKGEVVEEERHFGEFWTGLW